MDRVEGPETLIGESDGKAPHGFRSAEGREVRFAVATNVMDLELYLDEIIYALTQTVRKSGARTQSSETLFMLLMSNVRNDNALILLAIDEDMKLVGLLFAMADGVPKFAEVIAMWIKPSSWKDICMPALKILEEWGRTIGAKRMMAIVTRAPQKLFTKFYEPLGFEQVGLVLERRIS